MVSLWSKHFIDATLEMRKERLYKRKALCDVSAGNPRPLYSLLVELEFRNAIVSGVDSGLNELKIPDSITQKFAGFRNSD